MSTNPSGFITVPKGLAKVVVTDTELGDVRGDEGFYHYRQYSAVELAEQVGFEEAWHLIARGHLPSEAERAAFRAEAAAARPLPTSLLPVLEPLATATGPTLGRVRAAVSIAADELGLRPLIDLEPAERAAQGLRVAAVIFRVKALAGLEDRLANAYAGLWDAETPELNDSTIELQEKGRGTT